MPFAINDREFSSIMRIHNGPRDIWFANVQSRMVDREYKMRATITN